MLAVTHPEPCEECAAYLFARFDAGEDHRFPTHEAVLTSLLDIGIACPECGVPDVPCPTVLPEWDATSGGMRLLQ